MVVLPASVEWFRTFSRSTHEGGKASPKCTWANYPAESSSLAFSLGGDFLGGLPIGRGTKASTSDRRTTIRPAISRDESRFRWISLAIACLDTQRRRAASAWEIQSSKESRSFIVDNDTYFCYLLHGSFSPGLTISRQPPLHEWRSLLRAHVDQG